jgi:hypothetical protein
MQLKALDLMQVRIRFVSIVDDPTKLKRGFAIVDCPKFYAKKMGDALQAIAKYHSRPNEVLQVVAEREAAFM